MEQNELQNSGNIPNSSEPFGRLPNDSETFRTLPNSSELFRNLPHPFDRKENHTLSVREVARMFELSGVARTERSIINWCQPNKMGVSRLDCYFDPNERKYFLTPQSVELAIAEEKAKAAKLNSDTSEAVEDVPKVSEPSKNDPAPAPSTMDRKAEKDMQAEILDLKIANRAKDMWIETLKEERAGILDQLINTTRKVGELETKLLQLGAPDRIVQIGSEDQFRTTVEKPDSSGNL